MQQSFPLYSRSAKTGELGVSVVARIVIEDLGWLFVRRQQEHDFGIDGQIEYVSDSGQVTGQALGVQIKHGKSFFREKNRWGYVYRGEQRHFNYLYNYPLPVLIIIVHPDGTAYWERFTPALTERAGTSWTLTIPFDNKLRATKQKILDILGLPEDKFSKLSEYWDTNQQLKEAPAVLLQLDKIRDVQAMDTSYARMLFDRMLVTRELAAACQGKVELSFSGYSDDPRELFEIPIVRKYVAKLLTDLPELFFFHRTTAPTQGLSAIALCLGDAIWVDGRSTPEVTRQASLDFSQLAPHLDHLFSGLNEVASWIGLSEEEIKTISFAAAGCWGISPDLASDEA